MSVLDLNVANTRFATFNANNSVGAIVIGGTTNLPVTIYQNNAERIRLTGGLVGIGRTPTLKGLEVQSGILAGISDNEALRIPNDTGYVSFFNAANSVRTGYLQGNSSTGVTLSSEVSSLRLVGSGVLGLTLSSTALTDNINSMEIGWRSLKVSTPGNGSILIVEQRGGMVVGAFSSLVVNTGVFARGDVVTIYQDSASNMTLTQGAGFTLRLNGTATTGDRTILGRGECTLLFNSATEAIASGAVL